MTSLIVIMLIVNILLVITKSVIPIKLITVKAFRLTKVFVMNKWALIMRKLCPNKYEIENDSSEDEENSSSEEHQDDKSRV
jgi:predicted membrane protein